MTWHDFLILCRSLNVPLSLAAGGAIAVRINDLWARLSPGRRITWSGACAYVLWGSIASAIKLGLHRPVDETVLPPVLICLSILAGLWLSRHDQAPPAI